MRSKHGFTLLEILYVIVIVAILSAVATPFIRNWLADIRVKTAARQVQLDLMWARSQAIHLNTRVVIKVTAVGNATGCTVSGGGYTIFADNGAGGGIAGDGVQNGSEPTLKSVVFQAAGGPCISVSTTNPAGQVMGFTAKGLPLGGMQPFIDSNGNALVGRIQVSSTRSAWRLSTGIRLAGSVFSQTP
jgi:prepilin-type N-terminal cleavage/methylation domain-containing protein